MVTTLIKPSAKMIHAVLNKGHDAQEVLRVMKPSQEGVY